MSGYREDRGTTSPHPTPAGGRGVVPFHLSQRVRCSTTLPHPPQLEGMQYSTSTSISKYHLPHPSWRVGCSTTLPHQLEGWVQYHTIPPHRSWRREGCGTNTTPSHRSWRAGCSTVLVPPQLTPARGYCRCWKELERQIFFKFFQKVRLMIFFLIIFENLDTKQFSYVMSLFQTFTYSETFV